MPTAPDFPAHQDTPLTSRQPPKHIESIDQIEMDIDATHAHLDHKDMDIEFAHRFEFVYLIVYSIINVFIRICVRPGLHDMQNKVIPVI